MPGLGRYIYNGLTVLSLLVCLATVVLWVRSFWVCDLLERLDRPLDRSYNYHDTMSSHGGLQFAHLSYSAGYWSPKRVGWHYSSPSSPQYPTLSNGYWKWQSLKVTAKRQTIGFVMEHAECDGYGPPIHAESITLPFFFLTAVFALLPAHYFLRVRRRRRRTNRLSNGRCPVCTYDLRATPDRCPECGTVPTKGAS